MACIRTQSVTISVLIWNLFLSDILGFNLTILHTNDIHARYNETDKYSGKCTDSNCFGGAARLKTKIDEIRQKYPNTLLLDAGDQYQGTLWFNVYGGNITYEMMNILGYDAMALGNHEFDRNIAGLLPLLVNANFSILSCNIDTSTEPSVAPYIKKYHIAEVGGDKIGIIGYTTTQTPISSQPGSLKFLDEVESIRRQVVVLKSMGVNKIIALGHAGLLIDKKIAQEVEGIDIVVGGHTHSFLYSGSPPSNEDPVTDYPYVVTQSNDDKVLVVQDYAFGKYLGFLQVQFDSNGKIISFGGNPILLTSSIQKDPAIQNMIDTLGLAVLNSMSNVIGRTLVYLDGNRLVCRTKECNMGNLITDSMVYNNLRYIDSENGSKVLIAVVNGGSIRASFERGPITIGNAIEAQPFKNTLQTIKLKGKYLREALEFSVTALNPTDPRGRFLQVSGLKIKYDIKKPEYKRVVDVKVLCVDCKVPTYVDLESEKFYRIILSDFILGGGSGYTMIKEHAIQERIVGNLDSDVFAEYIQLFSPIYTGVEGRIEFVDTATYMCSNYVSSGNRLSASYNAITITFISFLYYLSYKF